MTPAQILAVLQAVAVLIGRRVLSPAAVGDNLGQFVVEAPDGTPIPVVLPLTAPLPLTLPQLVALAADAESRIQAVLRPFEGDCGRGFAPRGVLPVGSRGYGAAEGWV